MRARTVSQGNSRIVQVEGGLSNCAASPGGSITSPHRLVSGWRLVAANLALAVGVGLRLAGVDTFPISAHDHASGTVACQQADWLDDIIDTILGGGGSGGGSDGEGGERP